MPTPEEFTEWRLYADEVREVEKQLERLRSVPLYIPHLGEPTTLTQEFVQEVITHTVANLSGWINLRTHARTFRRLQAAYRRRIRQRWGFDIERLKSTDCVEVYGARELLEYTYMARKWWLIRLCRMRAYEALNKTEYPAAYRWAVFCNWMQDSSRMYFLMWDFLRNQTIFKPNVPGDLIHSQMRQSILSARRADSLDILGATWVAVADHPTASLDAIRDTVLEAISNVQPGTPLSTNRDTGEEQDIPDDALDPLAWLQAKEDAEISADRVECFLKSLAPREKEFVTVLTSLREENFDAKITDAEIAQRMTGRLPAHNIPNWRQRMWRKWEATRPKKD